MTRMVLVHGYGMAWSYDTFLDRRAWATLTIGLPGFWVSVLLGLKPRIRLGWHVRWDWRRKVK